MSIDALYPFAGDNAIQNVAFALEWTEELTNSDLLAVRALYDRDAELRKTFTQIQTGKLFVFNVSNDSPGTPVRGSPNEMGNVQFLRPSLSVLGAPSRALNVARDNCVAIVGEYTRWASVWPEIRALFLKVVPEVIGEGKHGVRVIGLQYTDIFHWKAAPATLNLAEVFEAKSRLLVPRVFDVRSLWHSHFGFLEDRAAPVAHSLLENVNVSMVANNGQLSLQIVSSHKATLSEAVWTVEGLGACINDLMEDLHGRNKAALDQLLSKEVKQKIKLNG